ncbi:MAG: response regulator transcription factor [Acidimicrobiia bacterium]
MERGIVLLIEDDRETVTSLKLHAEREGFGLAHVRTGAEGIAYVRAKTPRAVLVDAGLPGMDGFSVARSIRESSDIPILMIGGRDSEADTIISLEIGADDFIRKPSSPRELVARIGAVLRRSEPTSTAPTPTLRLSGHTVDAGRRHVEKPAGDIVRPTSREFDVLWYLGSNRGLVLSRDQILDGVWGYDAFAQSRTVDSHIRNLRRQLPDLEIETVWGVGYRLTG